MNFLLVGIGGFIGSIIRFYISTKANGHFIATWTANITGSIILAITIKLHATHIISDSIWLFLHVGFSGSYTTFSTFGHETLQLIFANKFKSAFIYVMSTIAISLVCVFFIFHFI